METTPELIAVARAIAQHFGPWTFDELPKDRSEQRRLALQGREFEDTQAGLLDAARDALLAIREPSDRVSAKVGILDGEPWVWRAMIDNILGDRT